MSILRPFAIIHGAKPIKLPKLMHTYSIEMLYHLNCGACDQWWTIGDLVPPDRMYCPHCGVEAEIRELDNG